MGDYNVRVVWKNQKEFRKHLKELEKIYGHGNIPAEEAVKFNYEFDYKPCGKLYDIYTSISKLFLNVFDKFAKRF